MKDLREDNVIMIINYQVRKENFLGSISLCWEGLKDI